MAQTKQEIEAVLAEAGSRPRQMFGQNFMIDRNLVRLVAEAGEISKDDLVIEVGPGTGTLTEELLERAGRVVAVEIDRDLAEVLRRKFEGGGGEGEKEDAGTRGHGDAGMGEGGMENGKLKMENGERDVGVRHEGSEAGIEGIGEERRGRFRLIEGDALAGKHALSEELLGAIRRGRGEGRRVKLVANLPYNIASPLVIEMLIAGVELLAFTVQKEVALRLGAKAGGEDYGPLSVMAQMLARVEVLRTLPAQAFWPAPKIESALVRLKRDDRLGESARQFGRFVHTLFSFRRKTLKRALAQAGLDAEGVLAATGFDGGRRGEEFSPEEFLAMFEAGKVGRD